MRGAGAVNWGGVLLYAYFTAGGGVTRVRLSADDADRLDVIKDSGWRWDCPAWSRSTGCSSASAASRRSRGRN